MSCIEPMHRRPAIEAVPYKCGNSFLSRDADQAWHKAVITIAVHGWGKPQHGCADSA
jgi:hypothetical protein